MPKNFVKTAKENFFSAAPDIIFETGLGGIRFLILAAAGICRGFLLYKLLQNVINQTVAVFYLLKREAGWFAL
jgi:hypothetical protein